MRHPLAEPLPPRVVCAGPAVRLACPKGGARSSLGARAGLVPPAAALYLLGRGGAILMVIMLFMAVTSSGSAELVAVSSLFTYDVYRTYINPNATGAAHAPKTCMSRVAVPGHPNSFILGVCPGNVLPVQLCGFESYCQLHPLCAWQATRSCASASSSSSSLASSWACWYSP